MDARALPAGVDVYYLTPTSQGRRGDREITCLFGDTDERGTPTGSPCDDETALDAHQLGYGLMDSERAVTAREALGPPATPPVHEENGGGAGQTPGKEE
ncbi:hypothetical protein GCM10022384_26810 [Streptomyces marokkonensis]|uniref:Uncharacterized protein n=1 Tax=Streptomyces marokkonensis TaxID=324855 RepID=A0ABP7Q2C1_9ACTN